MKLKLYSSSMPSSSLAFLIQLEIILFIIFTSCCATNLEEELRITYEEKNAINKLRQLVLPVITESYMKEDLHLLRYLRVTRFNIDDAYKRILENIRWRKESKMSTIVQEDFSDMKEDYPYTFTVDKQGQPAFFAFAGQWDVRNAALTGRGQRLVRYVNQALERGYRMIRELQYQGKNITRLNLIIDLDGFNVAQHGCMQCLLRILDFVILYENNYPGAADRVLFLNTPPSVAAAAELVRANVNSETMKSIKLLGSDRNVLQRTLLGFMNKDQLPEQFGGTLKRKNAIK